MPHEAHELIHSIATDEIDDFFEVNEEDTPSQIITNEAVTAVKIADIPPPVFSAPINNNDDWCALVQSLSLQGMAKALTLHCEFQKCSNEGLILSLAPNHSALYNPNSLSRLEDTLAQTFGGILKVTIEISETNDTPLQRTNMANKEKLIHLEDALRKDQTVSALLNHFQGRLEKVRLKDE